MQFKIKVKICCFIRFKLIFFSKFHSKLNFSSVVLSSIRRNKMRWINDQIVDLHNSFHVSNQFICQQMDNVRQSIQGRRLRCFSLECNGIINEIHILRCLLFICQQRIHIIVIDSGREIHNLSTSNEILSKREKVPWNDTEKLFYYNFCCNIVHNVSLFLSFTACNVWMYVRFIFTLLSTFLYLSSTTDTQKQRIKTKNCWFILLSTIIFVGTIEAVERIEKEIVKNNHKNLWSIFKILSTR